MKVVRLWGPVVVWMGIIFFFSTRQRIVVSDQYTVNFLFFKTLHVLEYAMLYLLTYRAMKNSYLKKQRVFWVLWSFIIIVLYASSDEIHQLFVPTREGAVRDVIIDTVGAAFAWVSITKLVPKAPGRLQKWVNCWLSI
jgi:VanZ family protein